MSVMRAKRNLTKCNGFTLIELILVVLILGMISVVSAQLLGLGVKTYRDVSGIEQVLGQSRFALERMTRELRQALPNSVRMSQGTDYQCLEFVPIVEGVSYLQAPIFPMPASTSLIFIAISSRQQNNQFTQLPSGAMFSLYPLTPADVYSNPRQTRGKLMAIADYQLSSESQAIGIIEFTQAVQFSEASPRQRGFIVSEPVSYCFEMQEQSLALYRYSDYGIDHVLPLTPTAMGNGVLMAEGVVNSLAIDAPIHVSPATLLNNAMVQLTPEFAIAGASFRYQQQIQVINAP